MKVFHQAFGLLVSAAVFAGGCADTGVQRVDSSNTEAQITTTGVDLADWEETAAAVTNSMIEEGLFDMRYDEKGAKAILYIDNYVNNTSINIDRDKIIRKVKGELRRTGKVNPAGDGPNAKQLAEEACFRNENLCADYFLTLKIIEDRAQDQRTRQRAYLIQMTLFDPDGFEQWDGEEVVIKQQRRRGVGL